MRYELSLDAYKGPLDKLLELVEEKKLEITQISLAEVTADFLEFLKNLEKEGVDRSLVAEFLVIGSKLILIKSKILLPSLTLGGEEESEIRDLETRLKIYEELKKAREEVKKRWSENPQMGAREFLANLERVFYPPEKLTKEDLRNALAKLVQELETIFKPTETIKIEIINLKTKIEEVLRKITEEPLGFRKLHGNRSKQELIVLFLAILHLIKDQLIWVEQKSHFEEMTITKKV